MSDNEKKEMLEKEEAVFDQKISTNELQQASGGNEEDALRGRGCPYPNALRGDFEKCERGNTLRENDLAALRQCERGNTLRSNA